MIVLKCLLILLIADLFTGIVHWMEDSYWSLETPILGPWLVKPNLDHHKNGQNFLKKSWFESSWDLLLLGVVIVITSYFTGYLTWEVWLFTVIIVNANQIHKWAHITRNENKPLLINLLQRLYLLQSTKHHGKHHRKPNDTHYCTVTNLLNPMLDHIKFWRGLELIFGKKRS